MGPACLPAPPRLTRHQRYTTTTIATTVRVLRAGGHLPLQLLPLGLPLLRRHVRAHGCVSQSCPARATLHESTDRPTNTTTITTDLILSPKHTQNTPSVAAAAGLLRVGQGRGAGLWGVRLLMPPPLPRRHELHRVNDDEAEVAGGRASVVTERGGRVGDASSSPWRAPVYLCVCTIIEFRPKPNVKKAKKRRSKGRPAPQEKKTVVGPSSARIGEKKIKTNKRQSTCVPF